MDASQPILTTLQQDALAKHIANSKQIDADFNEQMAKIREAADRLNEAADKAEKARDELRMASFEAYQAALREATQ